MPSCKVTIRMPGLAGAGGGETRDSDAAISSDCVVVVVGAVLALSGVSLPLIVDVEVVRPDSEFLRGPRWVSLNSGMGSVKLGQRRSREWYHFWLGSRTSLRAVERESIQRKYSVNGIKKEKNEKKGARRARTQWKR